MENGKIKKYKWSLLPVILTLAWPTMLEQLMQTAVQYIDTAMVGSIGTHATAAVGATSTVSWLIGSTVSALGVGFLSFLAQAYGAGDRDSASRAASQAVLAVLVSGGFFTVLALSLSGVVPALMQVDPEIRDISSRYFFIIYTPMLARAATIIFGTMLRAVGDTKTPMRVGIVVNVVNIILNFVMIYETRAYSLFGFDITVPGFGWGVLGAGIASAISFAVGGLLTTAAIWIHPVISPKGQKLKPDMEILRPCMKVALPNALQRFGTSLGFVAFAAMINSLGEVSTAAHTIANTVESAFYIPGYGMQTAAATLAGNAMGAGDKERMDELAKLVLLIEVLLMIVSGGLLFVFAPAMMSLFSSNPEVISLGAIVLRMVAVSEPFYGVSIIIEGMMLGVGNTVTPFAYNIIGMWGVRIVGTFIATQIFGYGLVAAWACMILHNLLLFALYMVQYFSGKWNPLNKSSVKNVV